jgi:hypothetical protein
MSNGRDAQGILQSVFDESAGALRMSGTGRSLEERYFSVANAYETTGRRAIANLALPGASGVVSLSALALPKGLTVTNMTMLSGSTAANGPTHWWMSLCDNAYTTLRSTADQTTTAFAGGASKTVALSSPFTTTYEGLYYFAFMMTATTAVISGLGLSEGAAGVAFSTLPYLALTGATGQTTAPADATNLAASPTASATPFYAYVT